MKTILNFLMDHSKFYTLDLYQVQLSPLQLQFTPSDYLFRAYLVVSNIIGDSHIRVLIVLSSFESMTQDIMDFYDGKNDDFFFTKTKVTVTIVSIMTS